MKASHSVLEKIAVLAMSLLLLFSIACGIMALSAEHTVKEQPETNPVTATPPSITVSETSVITDVQAPPPPEPHEPMLAFEALLTKAIEAHNFDLLQLLMSDTFSIAVWRSQGQTYSPDEAIEQLRHDYLGAGDTIRFQDASDLGQQLGGGDVLTVWDPAVNPVSALYSVGWGPEGKSEAFLIIAQQPDGTFY